MNCPTCGLDIDEHPANRCLDAWVAEEVMGLNVVSRDWPCGYGPDCGHYEASMQAEARYSWYTEKGPVYWEDVHGNGWGWPPWVDEDHGDLIACVEPVPFYSTHIVAAWDAVEKTKLFELNLLWYDGRNWVILAYEYLALEVAQAPSVALAICRAVLKVANSV